MNELTQSVVLGIVQGVTEFIPVSSTAHLVLIPKFLGWKGTVNTLEYDIALHGGTLLALLIYFKEQWIRLFTKELKLLFYLIVATVPAGVVGVLFEDYVSTTLRTPLIIAISLIVFGLFMLYSERYGGTKDIGRLTLFDSLIIGLFQSVALIPGVSRSGITISGGLLRGFRREEAARFSFLLSTPVIGGALVLEGLKVIKGNGVIEPEIMLGGFLSAFFSGLFVIWGLLWFFKRFSLKGFVYYRVLLAVIILLSLWLNV
ncbi:MAG: undecaprenyl-diphosphate phosphatase [Nitrospirae bacterium]|nr:MAG: undecaprenyl-diphosphate phosphatase [Nitrospirota bacterium]